MAAAGSEGHAHIRTDRLAHRSGDRANGRADRSWELGSLRARKGSQMILVSDLSNGVDGGVLYPP